MKIALCYSQLNTPQDQQNAGRMLELAETELKSYKADRTITDEQEQSLTLLRQIARSLIQAGRESAREAEAGTVPASTGKTDPKAELVRDLDRNMDRRDFRERLKRDDLELMLWAARVVVAQQLVRTEKAGPADGRTGPDRSTVLLAKLCRLIQENSVDDTLRYLRPAYDRADPDPVGRPTH